MSYLHVKCQAAFPVMPAFSILCQVQDTWGTCVVYYFHLLYSRSSCDLGLGNTLLKVYPAYQAPECVIFGHALVPFAFPKCMPKNYTGY